MGEETYAICNVGGQIFALSGSCPHAGGPLGYGTLWEHTIVCPLHAWEFDCRTGADQCNPDLRVPTFPAKVENGEILIEVPD